MYCAEVEECLHIEFNSLKKFICIYSIHFSHGDECVVLYLFSSFVGALPTSNVDGKNLDHVSMVCVCVKNSKYLLF